MPIEAAAPDRRSAEQTAALRQEAASQVCLEASDPAVLVGLSPDWVPVLSEAMLGETLEVGADGAADLVQEVAAQAFGTVQSTLATEGTPLPSLQFEAAGPGQSPAGPDGPAWYVSFSAEHEGSRLDGFVLLPASKETAEKPSRSPSSESRSAADSPSHAAPSASSEDTVDVAPAAFSDLGEENLEGSGEANDFGLLAEVNLEVRVELGRRELPLADVLKLTTGSVVELEKMVGEPLSVYANGRLIAEGEAVVIDEQFGVRITNLASETNRDKAFF